MKTKQKTYCVSFDMQLNIGFEITAESMEAAVAKAQGMKVGDIVDFDANGWDHNDSELELNGVFMVKR